MKINKKISQIDNKEPDNKFTDNMRFMIDSLLQSVNKISKINKKIAQIDKRIQTYDKVTTYPYGTNAFKVCESEMLSKNKLNRLDEDKDNTIPKTKTKDKDNTIPKTKTKTKAKTIHKTKDNDEDIDKDKTIPKTIVKIEDKAMSECKDENMLTKVYSKEEMKLIANNHWTRKKNCQDLLE